MMQKTSFNTQTPTTALIVFTLYTHKMPKKNSKIVCSRTNENSNSFIFHHLPVLFFINFFQCSYCSCWLFLQFYTYPSWTHQFPVCWVNFYRSTRPYFDFFAMFPFIFVGTCVLWIWTAYILHNTTCIIIMYYDYCKFALPYFIAKSKLWQQFSVLRITHTEHIIFFVAHLFIFRFFFSLLVYFFYCVKLR